ncbi:restriction endonuclease subunit S [Lachnospiraceae bacterium C1.1]|nr:restriction endonuclease subunit S [Lachnospiraceae bacterium C1.1]
MSKWKTCIIGDIGTVVGGATPSTKKEENYLDGTISWITPKDLAGFSGRYISRGERNITEIGLNSCSTQLMPAHTVLFSSRAPIGYVAIAENEVCTNQGFKSVIPNTDTDYMFLYYLLKYNKNKIENLGSGTTFKEVSGSTMRNVEIKVPETIEEQRKVASILSAIDDKIENNNAINDNLLQQISAIFKHWFTNNPELDSMTQVPLADLCAVVTKGTTPTTLGKPFVSKGINFIKAESIQDNHSIDKNKFAYIDDETNNLLKRSIISAGDIVFTIAGSLGRFAFVDDSVLPANTNQAVAIIRADTSKVTPEYLYSFFLGNWHNDYYTKRIQQAVQANLSLGTIKSLPIPVLSDQAMFEYLGLITPLIAMTKSNELEIVRLAQVRDTLLPQLMSGKLDVSNIDI